MNKEGSTQKPKQKVKHSQSKSLHSQIIKEQKLKKKLKECEKEIENLKDRLLRTAAELDNFRKRTERDVSQIIQNANQELIRSLLPIIDDFDRSLKFDHKKQKEEDFRQGIELIYKNLYDILVKAGLEPMESVGQPFDFEKHDALLQVEKKDTEPGMVVEEHEKGYLLNGRVLRHAKVIVSK
jgi:molecular chaperone GrpE